MTTSDYQGTPDGLTEAWRDRIDLGQPTAFPAMIDALRALQDQVTGSSPPEQVAGKIADAISALTRELAEYAVDERHQVAGHLVGIPGRGQCMSPAVEITEYSDTHARGHVSFGRFYLGGNGAVHGGAIPLVFDELMGRLANTGGRRPSRTAYLHVNYRNITPIETGSPSRRTSIASRVASASCAEPSATGTRSAPTPRACSSPCAPASRNRADRNRADRQAASRTRAAASGPAGAAGRR